MSRTQSIIGRVRKLIIEESFKNILDEELFDIANQIQSDILLSTRCKKKSFTIKITASKKSYDFVDENSIVIITAFASNTTEKIQYVPYTDWESYKDLTGSAIAYCTLFDNQIFFSPVPSGTTIVTVTIWAFQTATIEEMNAETDPEIPINCDLCLMYGILSVIDPNYMSKYEQEKMKLATKLNNNTLMPKQMSGSW